MKNLVFLLYLLLSVPFFTNSMESNMEIEEESENKNHLEKKLNYFKSDTPQVDKKPPLHEAIFNNDQKAAKELIFNGADINERHNGLTPLHLACQKGNLSIIRKLITAGADVNMPLRSNLDNQPITYPIHIATENNDQPLITLLALKGATVNNPDNNEYTPLHLATKHNDKRLIQTLLDCNADPLQGVKFDDKTTFYPIDIAILDNNTLAVQKLINTLSPHKYSLLHQAIEQGNLWDIERYIFHGADVNIQGLEDNTPLHCACVMQNSATIIKLLLERGAKSNVQTLKDKFTPLMLAILSIKNNTPEASIKEKVALLIQYGASVNIQSATGITALHLAVKFGLDSVVELLIEDQVNVNQANNNNSTPLHFAAELKDSEKAFTIATQLLKAGAKPDLQTLIFSVKNNHIKLTELLLHYKIQSAVDDQVNMIHCAIRSMNKKIVEILLKNGLQNIHVIDEKLNGLLLFTLMIYKQDYPLEPAEKCIDILDLLLKNGININQKNKINYTPLALAIRLESVEIVKFLLEKNAAIDLIIHELSLLHLAVITKNYEIIKLLVQYGINLNSLTTYNETALHLAVELQLVEVVQLLLDRGSDRNIKNNNNELPIDIAQKKEFTATIELLK